MQVTDYPELHRIRKELGLLQKLYQLYNSVLERVREYNDIPWLDVNIDRINAELVEFQNRCVHLRVRRQINHITCRFFRSHFFVF